ncbi:Sphingomyelin synthetase family protein [Abeliophyllum distichum]|uniref:Sphingomyelin synthetase family protein n=1 Tax=Abeliophyllum distichum TaxID=126358 RepID=A0ABD1S8X1_9LAMI
MHPPSSSRRLHRGGGGLGLAANRVREHRLPPPPLTDVARATAACSLGCPRPGRHCSRPVLQALVLGAPLSSSLHLLHALHALCSPLRSHFCSVRHCCTWSRLAQCSNRLFLMLASGCCWGLNEKVPQTVVNILRARIIGLHHFLMLFIMLGFSVLFDSVEAPGLGLGARYMFTMGIGRLLRAMAFVSTILPSPRPWCASARFQVPPNAHRWAQKYYVPYATDSSAIRQIIHYDIAYADPGEYNVDFQPDWGSMSFLADFLRPTASEGSSSWYHLLKKAGGGCNDLLYSGHMLVAVLTAMAWTEAYGGFTSALIWILVLHSAQREIRERHHYSVDCLVAIYMGILLWKMTGLFWPVKDASRDRRLKKLERIQNRLIQAAKDSDMDQVRELLNEVESSGQVRQSPKSRVMWLFSGATIFFTLGIVLLAFTLTSDG